MHGVERNRGRRASGHRSGAFDWTFGFAHRLGEAMLAKIDAGLAEGSIDATLPGIGRRRIGGHAPGPDAIVIVHRWQALFRLATGGSAGWYEAWAAGEWESPDPVVLFELFTRNRGPLGNTARAGGAGRWIRRWLHALHRNSHRGARRNIVYHYDLGNDFYRPWLDAGMTYSSALFDGSEVTLEAAQEAKLQAAFDRTGARAGDRILEIGCGWGSFIDLAARNGVAVTGLTLSEEQRRAAERRAGAGADVRLLDYRDITGSYDAVVSVEMVEAVGLEYWDIYLATVARSLKPGGRAAIQYIAIDDAIFDAYAANVDFIQAYVFPGGMLLSEGRFRGLAAKHGLSWHDRTGFALSYAETLRQWRAAFDLAVAEARLPPEFDHDFCNLWRYYLMYCEGGFRGGAIDVAQVTLIKEE